MKQIEVDDDTYNFLVKCQKELHEQDNRSTANVIFFNQYEKRCYAEYHDDYHSDGYEWYNPNWDNGSRGVESDEELVDYLLEYGDEEEIDALNKLYTKDIENMINSEKPTLKEWFIAMIDEKQQYSGHSELIDYIEDYIEQINNAIGEEQEVTIEDFDSWKDITKISYSKDYKIAESGLFSFFSSDIEEHKRLDGHNYRPNTRSYGGSIQRTPNMLQLREWLLNQNFSTKE
jgi:hypothetical protein